MPLQIEGVRNGRVISTGFLRSEIQIELALIAEAQGRNTEAAGAFDKAIAAARKRAEELAG